MNPIGDADDLLAATVVLLQPDLNYIGPFRQLDEQLRASPCPSVHSLVWISHRKQRDPRRVRKAQGTNESVKARG